MKVRLRAILIICLPGVFLALSNATAWQQWYDDNYQIILYRPTDDGITRPSPGVPPAILDVNYDLHNAPAGVVDDVLEAMTVWNSVEGATISLQDAGETACCTDGYNCWCSDGVNTVSWVASNWPSYFGPNVLAVTQPEDWDPGAGVVNETDIMINGVNFRWSVGRLPRAGEHDLLSVIVHEMGHFCMLDDLYDYRSSQSTMYGYISSGSARPRTLDQDDMDGLRFMYPETENDLPPPRVTGFVKQGDIVVYDKLIEDAGTLLSNIKVKGYGFVTEPLELEVWQTGAPVISPEAVLAQFIDYAELKIDVNFTGSAGGYDLRVINPNTKDDIVAGALQVNAPGNTAPVVYAGSDLTVYVKKNRTVCATASDPDGGDTITYSWELVVQPEESTATLADANLDCANFTPDKKGYYLLEVTVSDGTVISYADATLVRARIKPSGGSGGGGSSGGCLRVANLDGPPGESFPADILLLIFVPFLLTLLKRKTFIGEKNGSN